MNINIINRNYQTYKLDNGLVVAMQNTPTQTAIVGLNVNYGYAHDTETKRGLVHFLEHVLFNSGTTNHSYKDMIKIKDNFGQCNASTFAERTYFNANILPEGLEFCLNFLSSIAFDSNLDSEVIKTEKKRILREIGEIRGNPSYNDGRKLLKKVLGKKHPLSLNGIGNGSDILSFNQEDLNEPYLKGYGANNMELYLVGKLPETIRKLIKKYFGNKPSGKNTKIKFPYIESLKRIIIMHTFAPDLINKDNPKESNSQIQLGIIVPPKTHEDSNSLDMIARILGDGGNSRLFKKISEEKGFAYSINSNYDGDYNNGFINIMTSVHADKQDEAINLIFKEFEKLQEKPIDSSELDTRKQKLRYNLIKHFETNNGHLDAIYTELSDGLTIERIISETEKLTPKKIQETAIKYLPKSREDNSYALLIRDPLKK